MVFSKASSLVLDAMKRAGPMSFQGQPSLADWITLIRRPPFNHYLRI